jgi:predicted DNA-binding transcriptional regulator YafY
MGVFQATERIVWFDGRIRANCYLNAGTMAQRFEVSVKTAQRTINFIRDRLQAPLEYDPSRRGYLYFVPDYVLPFAQISQEEMLALLLARNLLASSVGGAVSTAIKGFSRGLFATTRGMGLTRKRMEQGFSAQWHGFSPAQAEIFRQASRALLENRLLDFNYSSPGSGRCGPRSVKPYHLQHYMGSWVLIAWCKLRRDWRKFYLSRMDRVHVQEQTFTPRPREHWMHQVEGAFGIFQGPETVNVRLAFSSFMARWIREQIWHPGQKVTARPDGGLELSFPVADFREVKWKILQFGSHVRVLEPQKLQDEIREEIGRMTGLYGGGSNVSDTS